MSKIVTLKKSSTIATNLRNQGKTVGLVCGSFDICHLGHLNLFKLAKKHVDVLFVGLDHDETIRLTKGEKRPINNFSQRSAFLAELRNIDYIFLIETISVHGSEEAAQGFKQVLDLLAPTHVFTHKTCDRHWSEKKKLAESNGIKIIFDTSKYVTNSGLLIKKLEEI